MELGKRVKKDEGRIYTIRTPRTMSVPDHVSVPCILSPAALDEMSPD